MHARVTDTLFMREPLLLHQLIESQVQKTPHGVALEFGDQYLTYAQLNAKANRLAHRLIELGVSRETVVGLYLERGIDQVVAVLAVLKAGGAFLPLEVHHPQARLNLILEQGRVQYLLTKDEFSHRWGEFTGQLLLIDARAHSLDMKSEANPELAIHPDQLAYVIFTSGSTGVPKGVMGTHRGVVNYLRYLKEQYAFGEDTVALQLAAYSFDAVMRDLFLPLMLGGKVILLTPKEAASPREILWKIKDRRVTAILSLVPTTLRTLLSEWEYSPISMPGLRWVFVSGEILKYEDCKRAQDAWGAQLLLVNQYGPTETTMVATNYVVPPLDQNTEISIGKAIHGMRLYVLNEFLDPAPTGVEGELYIGGVGVTRGYFAQPAQTAQVFLPDPYATEPGARMYRTGDWGCWLPDGRLQFKRRKDWQVKIHGNRVELEEIEATLRLHPGVQNAVVNFTQEDEELGLTAYIVPKARSYVRDDDLSSFLAARLPPWMLPQRYFFLETLPVTYSGKVNRQALPKPARRQKPPASDFEIPRHTVEHVVAMVWRQVLNIERIGPQDHFFALGGHSLSAMQVIVRLQEVCGVELPLALFFENPTVSVLAQALRARGAKSVAAENSTELLDARVSTEIQPEIYSEPGSSSHARTPPGEFQTKQIPASFNQHGLWFIQLYYADTVAYNLPRAFWLRGEVHIEALQHAIDTLTQRHEVLRTAFITKEDGLYQCIYPHVEMRMTIDDLRGMPIRDRKAEAMHKIEEAFAQPFDLEVCPLWRVGLVRLSDDLFALYFVFHHLIIDAWSLDTFFRELRLAYEAEIMGLPKLLSAPGQYADFTLWQRQWSEEEGFKRQLAYWVDRLSEAPQLLTLPMNFPRPAAQTLRGRSLYCSIPDEVTRELKRFSSSMNTSLYQYLLACFYVLLYQLSGEKDLIVGTPVAHRHRKEFTSMLGFFVNTLALRLRLHDTMRFIDLLSQVKEVALEAFEHQDVSFDQVVEALKLPRNPAFHPLFQVMFSFQTIEEHLSLPETTSELILFDRGISRFDLSMTLWEHEGSLSGRLEYNQDVFLEDSAQRMLNAYQFLLASLWRSPETPLHQITLLSATEKQRILKDYNQTFSEYDVQRTVIDNFRYWVGRTPEAIAVVHQTSQICYADLDRQANQLAHGLQSHGVGREDFVAICLPRGIEWIIAILGIWKAGAAYVPLDIDLPFERMEFMLSDARASLLITNDTLAPQFSRSATQTLLLEEILEHDAPKEPIPVEISPAQAAYIIYTSGSTGTPKGVVVTHGNLSHLIHWHTRNFSISNRDRATQVASFSFDASVWEIWPYLCAGACVHILTDEVRANPETLLAYWREHQITMAFVPTPITEDIFSMPIELNLPVRYLLKGGEQLHRYPSKGWQFSVVNNYGPTECTVVSSSIVLPHALSSTSTPPIGKPITNVRMYILDAQMQPVLEGVMGEIYIAGEGISRGYFNQPGLTAASFLPDPFQGGGMRMYRTGDLGRYNHDGSIAFLGRRDHQVKLRGYRIELSEIEHVLRTHQAVQQAVVLLRSKDTPQASLVAFIEAKVGASISKDELFSHMRCKLPAYMLPAQIVVLQEFPLTPSGKVDRKKLAEFPLQNVDDHIGDPIGNATEQVIAEVWKSLLNVSEVGAQQNFFSLGGHSLLAIRLASSIQKLYAIEFPVRLVFEHPTVAGMAQELEQKFSSKEQLERASKLLLEMLALDGVESAASCNDDEL